MHTYTHSMIHTYTLTCMHKFTATLYAFSKFMNVIDF